MKTNIKSNLKNIWPIIALPVFMLFIIGPLEIYTGNMDEFIFSVFQFLPIFIIAAVVIILAALILLSIFPDKILKFIISIVFSISLSMYIQNMFMNRYIFQEDGSSVDLSGVKSYTTATNLIWVGIIVIAIVLTLLVKNISTIEKYISLFLLCVLFITSVSMIITASSKTFSNDHYILDGSNQYTVAPENNIIIVILDRYSNSTFDEALANHPEIADIYSDFTYYNNAECCYSYTFPSLIHLSTGIDPDVSLSRSEYCEKAWHSDRSTEFYNMLHTAGYQCNMYSSEEAYIVLGDLNRLVGSFDNMKEEIPRKDTKLLISLLTKMSIYKYTPYLMKPYFELKSSSAFKDVLVYDKSDGTIEYNMYEFYPELRDKGLSVDNSIQNKFAIMHLSGVHDHTIDADGNYIEESASNMDNTVQGVALSTKLYLDELKRLGVYDNSTIIFMSDHGKIEGDTFGPQPLFLIKKLGESHGKMLINTAPISYDDLQATVLTTAGIEYNHEIYGEDIFYWNEDDKRERQSRFLSDGFKVYTYTGDRNELMKKITEENFDKENSSEW